MKVKVKVPRALLWLAFAAVLVLASLAPRGAVAGWGQAVRLTYYLPTGDPMYSGIYPYSGAAACSWNFPIGTVLEFPYGDQVVCLDRGMLGSSGWVDRFVWSHGEGLYWESLYGQWTSVTVVRWGWGPE